MLNGYISGKERLSMQEFKNKYWMGGQKEYIYQFHTMDIEDGLSERQQLLINNDRALYKLIIAIWEKQFKCDNKVYSLESKLIKSKKIIAVLIMLNTAIAGMFIKIIHSLSSR